MTDGGEDAGASDDAGDGSEEDWRATEELACRSTDAGCETCRSAGLLAADGVITGAVATVEDDAEDSTVAVGAFDALDMRCDVKEGDAKGRITKHERHADKRTGEGRHDAGVG